ALPPRTPRFPRAPPPSGGRRSAFALRRERGLASAAPVGDTTQAYTTALWRDAEVEEFLGLPSRPGKPRERGWTHVIDKGLTLAEVSGVLELAGDYIDIVKLGWGTSYVAGKLAEKLRLYRDAGIPVMTGGTLLEAAIARDRLDEFRQWTADHGFTHIEVSDGTIDLDRGRKV